jgi:hypothetical protein
MMDNIITELKKVGFNQIKLNKNITIPIYSNLPKPQARIEGKREA